MIKGEVVTKIDPKKIIKAAIGSAQLEGYKGSVNPSLDSSQINSQTTSNHPSSSDEKKSR
jgi:hypothetical protein